MSIDHLQIGISDVIYNNSTWLYETITNNNNDAIDALEALNTAFENIPGLTKKGSLIRCSDTSGTDNMQWEIQGPTYGGESFISHSNAQTLRNNLITQMASITNLQSYKDISIRSYRNDMVSSDNYIFSNEKSDEGLEIFVSNIFYKNSSYIEVIDIDTLLSDVNNAFDNINGFEFAGIVISTWHAGNDGIFIGVDSASYFGNKYISLANAQTLRNEIFTAIATITDLDETSAEVEIKIGKRDNQASS